MFARARLQLTLAYAAILGISLAILGGSAYAVTRHQLDDEINRSLSSSATELQSLPPGSLEPAPTPTPADSSHEDHEGGEHDENGDDGGVAGLAADVFFVTTDSSGSMLTNPRRVDLTGIEFANLVVRANSGNYRADIDTEGGRYRVLTLAMDGAGASFLHVGRSLKARDSQLRTLALVFGLGGVVGIVLSGAGGYWLAGRTLRPIRDSLETQRRFVSDASHELRTPISVVKANNELLLRHPDQTIEANLDQVEAIAVESDHMARLVGDLLTLARADEGIAQLSHENFDLAALAAEVARDMEPLAAAKGLRLNTRFLPAEVVGDSQRLRQLVAILIDNAIKYTPEGGTISVSCRPAGRNVELNVTDTGPGIAPADHERIFDRFYRVDKSRSRAEGGSGLGLAIARWIAEAHGGRLMLRSREGDGSTFTFRMAGGE